MNGCSCNLQQHYSSSCWFQCHTNTDDHHETNPLYSTCLNSDDHGPPVHHIALRHWTFHSPLSTPMFVKLWSFHNRASANPTVVTASPLHYHSLDQFLPTIYLCEPSAIANVLPHHLTMRGAPLPHIVSTQVLKLSSHGGWMQNLDHVHFGKVQMHQEKQSLEIPLNFLLISKNQEILGNCGNSQEILVTAANFLECSEILRLFS